MRRLTWLAGLAAVSLLLVTQTTFAGGGPCTALQTANGKVTICHHPPGNPGNVQILCIDRSAVPAHCGPLGHNDPSECDPNCASTCPTGCDDLNACTEDSCGATGCIHAPIQGCCLTAADCADDGNPCTTATCTANVCGTAPVSGCCNTPADCPDDGDVCTTATCVANVCGIETAPGPVCCPVNDFHCNAAACCAACPSGSACSETTVCTAHAATDPECLNDPTGLACSTCDPPQ